MKSGCAPHTFGALTVSQPLAAAPRFEPDREVFVSFDGAELGLTVWAPEGEPDVVVVGLHGMNDYANAFHMAAPYWAERGVVTYAYDQRGFGRSPGRGYWPEEDVLRADLRAAIDAARARHPGAVLAVVGISMGGAVAMTLAAEPDAPAVDRWIFSGPGLRGWRTLNPLYASSLWVSAHVRPGWIVRPPRFVEIWPSDNIEMLRALGRDPLGLRETRIDAVYGVVSLMNRASKAAARLPDNALILAGAKDEVIPPGAARLAAEDAPDHVRTALYEDGWHMLMRDLQAETVWEDALAFMRDPEAPLPSGAPPIADGYLVVDDQRELSPG